MPLIELLRLVMNISSWAWLQSIGHAQFGMFQFKTKIQNGADFRSSHGKSKVPFKPVKLMPNVPWGNSKANVVYFKETKEDNLNDTI